MPRSRRITPAGQVFHIVNRGNEGKQLFFQTEEYQQFIDLLGEAKLRYPMKVYGYCIMSTHFHLVVAPTRDGAVSAFMQWLTGRHACYLRFDTRTVGRGHVYQQRFWSDAIRDSRHFMNVLRYVEANGLRARIVERAERWQWSSLWERIGGERFLLDTPPISLPDDWITIVNAVQMPQELDELRRPRQPGRPAAPFDLRKPKKGV